MANDGGVRPGWYTDPLGRFELRYYNGTSWTADVSVGGSRFVDPDGVNVDPRPSTPGPDPERANSAATAAMTLGIVAVAIAWLPFIVVLGVIAAVLAMTFGVVGVRRAGSSGVGRSRAIVGLVTGASAIVAAALGAMLTFIVLDVYDEYIDPGPHETAITSCELVGSRATATGALTNLGTESADFSVLIGFVRPSTDNPHRTIRAVLDNVGAGQRAEFEVERQVDVDEVECIVIEVNGPLPFGLSLD